MPKERDATFDKASDQLFQAVLSLKNIKECEAFFRDLCTISEIKAMVERWQIVGWLRKGKSYREIAKITGASTTTITRVAFWMERGTGGYQTIFSRVNH